MTMQVLIDADGCPVVDITVRLSKKAQKKCIILCDTAHEINRQGAETMVVSKGADSVDFRLVNLVQKEDIVITQDYGLAAMCLSKNAYVLNQNGMEYTAENIDGLLLARHTAKKIRRGGGRLSGPQKRTHEQDVSFELALSKLLKI